MVCGDRQNVQRELAASTCVERQIRMPEIPDKVVFDRQITFVYRRHERQLVHVLEHLTWRIVSDGTEPVAIREAIDARPVLPFCNVLADAVRLPAGSAATFAPTKPAFRAGLAAFSAPKAHRSDENEGVEV